MAKIEKLANPELKPYYSVRDELTVVNDLTH